jgi:hypothetical protein
MDLGPLANPFDEMIFECSFDKLMKQVRRKELVYISTREMTREGLRTNQIRYI